MNILYAAIISAAVAFGAAWKVQGWRYGEEIAQIKTAVEKDAREAQEKAQQNYERQIAQKDEAINEATKRAQSNARAAATLRAESDGLRDLLAANSASLSTSTDATCRKYAAALSDVLGAMEKAGGRISSEADGHSSDSLMYQEAWPK